MHVERLLRIGMVKDTVLILQILRIFQKHLKAFGMILPELSLIRSYWNVLISDHKKIPSL